MGDIGIDEAWWMGASNGIFSVKSAWELLRHKKEEWEIYSKVWNKKLPFKINFFLWRAGKGKIVNDDNLQRMRISIVSKCC